MGTDLSIIGGNGELFGASGRFETGDLAALHLVIGEPPVRKARAGVLAGSTLWMAGGERLAFTPANIATRSDFEGKLWTPFESGGDDGDSSF